MISDAAGLLPGLGEGYQIPAWCGIIGSMNRNLSDAQFRWVTTQDRDGRRAYATPGGSIVSKDGTGPTPVTVYYPGHDWSNPDYGMVDTVAEGKAWAEDAERHS